MRKTLIIPALLAILALGAAQAYAQTATVVTHSGQRIRGQLVTMANSGDVVVRSNGRDNRIPMSDVAMIDFAGGNIPQGEFARANQNYGGLVVLRSGRTVPGRVVDMRSNQAVLEDNAGQRNIALNQVARIYFGTGNGYDQYGQNGTQQYGTPQYGTYNPNNVYDPNYNPNNPNNPNTVGYGQSGSRGRYGRTANGNTGRTFTVPTNQQWTDTGINVQRGQTIQFRASGNVTLSENGADQGTPAGANNGRMAGNSPLPGVTGGMLIGRVGNGQPFAIGTQSTVTMPVSGRLYLGINDDYVGDNTGNFVVEIR
jgi:hypothetical protein